MNTSGSFNYISEATPSSLYRNGRVLIERDADGNTRSSRGIDLEARELAVEDARSGGMSLEINGFEMLAEPAPRGIDFLNHQSVLKTCYGHSAELVSNVTGARAFAFDHNVRSASGKQQASRISGGQAVQEPAHLVHGDYTLTSAPERIAQLARPPSGNDTLRGHLADGQSLLPRDLAEASLREGGRFAIINVWRNVDDFPVTSHPMAFCDSQTVTPEDLVVFEIHYSDRVGENYFSKHTDEHRMYYFPEITRDEVILIKQWDSAGPLARSSGHSADQSTPSAPCTFSFHSAFEDSNQVGEIRDRWSIEVRCAVLYE